MSILTFTMSNIIFINHKVNSPELTCIIDISENGTCKCHIYETWVTKGKGKIDITFRNCSDFRTIVQVDMLGICNELFKSLAHMHISAGVLMTGFRDEIIYLGVDHFDEGWLAHHNTLMVRDTTYTLSKLRVRFDIIE
jgi:hypothetical protein